LKFIGEVSEARLAEINNALIGLEGERFPITVRGVGFFPNARSPRVFWAGLDAAPLPRLAENVEARMARIGLEREKRAFQAHVTLARAREIRIDSSLVAAAAKYSEQIFGTFTVDRVFLVQSTLKPSGAIYNKLEEYPLAIQ
jgi:RNA 2',3'-cyclic 3'-phosphodiesterase